VGFATFTEARSIAVVGASPRNLLARITLDNLTRWRFPGRVVGIHPKAEPVEEVPSFATYQEAGPVDLAVFAVGSGRLIEAVEMAASAAVRAAVIPGAGANEGGRAIEADLRRAVDRTGIDVVGPNCMGFASLHEHVVPYVGTLDPDLQPGRVGLVSQSGSVCELFTALPWRIGFSHVISVGNELGVDLSAALDFLVHDERTEVIGLFVEGVRRPDSFRAGLRAAADAGKTVVALKVGRSETARAGTVAHTGALAGDAAVFSAVLRDAGGIEPADLDEMFVLLELLGKGLRRPPGRVVYAGDSGGQANLFADLAAEHGVQLPPLQDATRRALREQFPTIGDDANPLDLWALGEPSATYEDGVRLLVDHEPHLVVLGLDKFLARTEPERAFVRAGVAAVPEPGAVVLMAYAGSDSADVETLRTAWERRVPVVRGAGRTLRALAAMAARDAWRLDAAHGRPAAAMDAAIAVAGETTEWTEHAAKLLLAAAGIDVTEEEEVAAPEAAVDAALRIGFPVVVKAAGPGIAHKTESGGVRLGLATIDEVEAAAKDLLAAAPRVLVAEQRTADLELILGSFVDEQFGPCALLGVGGVWTEAFRESVVVAGPATETTVRRALATTRWGRLLLEGARGRRFRSDAVVDCCLRLLDLIGATGLGIVEINPLFVEPNGVVAVDALVEPAP
jgi:acyl-CoA synthetase (NDP forming)